MTTLTKHPSAYTATTGFDENLAGPENAYADDAAYATASTGRKKEMATNFRGFDFSSIPAGSAINTVNVYIKKKLSAAWSEGQWRSSVWNDVTVSAALTAGTTGAIGPNLQYTTDTNTATENTWNYTCTGTLPTLAQLKAANFGIRVQGAQENNGTVHTWSVNDIYITVDYTAPFNLTASNLTSGTPVLGTPAVVIFFPLSANTLLSGISQPGNPTLTVIIDLSANNLLSGIPDLANPVLAISVYPLYAGDITSQNPLTGLPILGIIIALTASDIESLNPVLGIPSLKTFWILIIDGTLSPVLQIGNSYENTLLIDMN